MYYWAFWFTFSCTRICTWAQTKTKTNWVCTHRHILPSPGKEYHDANSSQYCSEAAEKPCEWIKRDCQACSPQTCTIVTHRAGVVGNPARTRVGPGKAAQDPAPLWPTPPHLLPAAAHGRSPSPRKPGQPGGRHPATAARSPPTWRRGLCAKRRSAQPVPLSTVTRGGHAVPP